MFAMAAAIGMHKKMHATAKPPAIARASVLAKPNGGQETDRRGRVDINGCGNPAELYLPSSLTAVFSSLSLGSLPSSLTLIFNSFNSGSLGTLWPDSRSRR